MVMSAVLINEPDVILYTDGACSGNPGPGGWAVILKHPATEAVRSLSGGEPETTNNRMELLAAINGLRALDSDKRLRVRLVSDSEYVLKGLTCRGTRSDCRRTATVQRGDGGRQTLSGRRQDREIFPGQ